MDDECDELSEFLDLLEEDCAADAISNSQQTIPSAAPTKTGLREILNPDDFLRPQDDAAPSAIHAGDTDSSDDEDNRNCQEQSFNSSGRDVKQMITAKEKEASDKSFSLGGFKGFTQKSVQNDPKVSWSRNQAVAIQGPVALKKAERVSGLTGKLLDVADRDCFLEPVSGIRVLNPLVTQAFLQERTAGRQTVACSMVKRKYESKALQDDWLTTGVVTSVMKRVSQKSKEYLSWTISDLKHDMLTVTVFLFSAANSAFSQVTKGFVIGLLNPTVLPPSSSKYDLILSVNDAQRVLIIGQSKDFGICKSKTAKNEPCSNFVNVNICPYCTYHLSKEYKKHSGKPTAPGSNLMAKVLGKSEVFYGGKSFSAKMNPPKKISREHLAQLALPQANNKKIVARDHQRVQSLQGPKSMECSSKPSVISVDPKSLKPKNITRAHHIMINARKPTATVTSVDQKPVAATSKLTGLLGKKGADNPSPPLPSPKVPAIAPKIDASKFGRKSSSSSCPTPKPLVTEQKPNVDLSALSKPTLSKFGSIDLSDLGRRKSGGGNSKQNAKLAALQLIRKKGPLKKENPNLVKKAATKSKVDASLKRKISRGTDEDDETKLRAEFEKKKAKFLQLIETGSRHQDLVASAEQEAEDNYFNNMETKEKIEDKMLNTHKVEAKAVQCTQCNYTALARSDFCRKQGHQIKIVQAHKRFFQCKGCKNHIWVLGIVPTTACSNCGQSHWEKAGMIRDKSAKLDTLRISAGDRDTFTPANINSLVPD